MSLHELFYTWVVSVGGVDLLRLSDAILHAWRFGVPIVKVNKYSIHGHRTLKAPHPVRSPQLTRVPPVVHGGGPRRES